MTPDLNPHAQAMEAAFFADAARRQGNPEKAAELFAQALDWELRCLAEMKPTDGLRWSVLHRSAGWLALDCGQPRLAEKLACAALAGDPDPAMAGQLREVLAAAHKRMGVDGNAGSAAPGRERVQERAAEPGEVAAC